MAACDASHRIFDARAPGAPSNGLLATDGTTIAAIVAILAPWAWLRWLLAAWVVYYVLRAKREIYRGSRLGGVLRTLFVAVICTILFFFATIALIFPAILLR